MQNVKNLLNSLILTKIVTFWSSSSMLGDPASNPDAVRISPLSTFDVMAHLNFVRTIWEVTVEPRPIEHYKMSLSYDVWIWDFKENIQMLTLSPNILIIYDMFY